MRSSATASVVSRVEICTRVDSARFLHKPLHLRRRRLAKSDIPQCPRPFTDRLVIDFIVTRGPNDRTEWVCVPVEWKVGEFERMPQKLFGPSPPLVVRDYLEHRA